MRTHHIAAAPERVLAAAEERIALGFADPAAVTIEGSTITWTARADLVDEATRVATVEPDGDGAVVTLRADYRLSMPYFGWLYRPLIRRALNRSLDHIAAVLAARATEAPQPEPPRRPVWLPNDPLDATQTATLAAIAAVLVVAGYGGGLFTQTIDFVAKSFHASDADLGVALAVTRVGTLVGIAGSALADRRGRRSIMLGATVAICAASAFTALSPNLAVFTLLQVIVRGSVQLATVVGFIAVTEEAPEGSRAYLLAIAGAAAGAGFAFGALILPISDIARWAWRLMFVISGLGLVAVPAVSRRLRETGRYSAMGARAAAARAKELVDNVYGSRFAYVAAAVFLLGFFGTPSLQFTNRYLQDERHFSAFGIVALRAVTQSIPALVGIIAGGRLAESHGRRPIAAWSTFVLAIATAGFFLFGGPGLWFAMFVATVAGAMSGPALTAFNTELFPTEVRGRAVGALLGFGVAGSAMGLLLVGYLSDPLGGVGKAVAVTCVVPLIVAAFVIPKLPEGRGRALDELSPPEV